MSSSTKPSPAKLWEQAEREFPHLKRSRTERYLELMREHGHIVKRAPGDDRPLFPCGYEPKRGD